MNQEELKTWLDYDSKTGIFTWKVSKNSRARKGSTAGSVRHDRYIEIRLNYKSYLAHRLAWFYVYGYWPNEIDHIDRNSSNNKIENLREVSRTQNQINTGLWAHNTSGTKGVYWHKAANKWEVRFGRKGYIGLFNTKKEAIAARKQAEEAC